MPSPIETWPSHWNDGARSSVEPFLHSFLGVELSDSWQWLVTHRELAVLPDAAYNPLADARKHMVAHTRDLCDACAVWRMLTTLWNVTHELYELRHMQYLLRSRRSAQRILRGLGQALAAQQRAPPPRGPPVRMEELRMKLEADVEALEQFSKQVPHMFSEDGRVALRGRRPMLVKLCKELRQGGFKYDEIAVLIGDRARGARDRIRVRCATGERSKRRM